MSSIFNRHYIGFRCSPIISTTLLYTFYVICATVADNVIPTSLTRMPIYHYYHDTNGLNAPPYLCQSPWEWTQNKRCLARRGSYHDPSRTDMYGNQGWGWGWGNSEHKDEDSSSKDLLGLLFGLTSLKESGLQKLELLFDLKGLKLKKLLTFLVLLGLKGLFSILAVASIIGVELALLPSILSMMLMPFFNQIIANQQQTLATLQSLNMFFTQPAPITGPTGPTGG